MSRIASFLVCALLASTAASAQAGIVLHITGTFGPDFNGTTGLANGSFVADVTLPASATLPYGGSLALLPEFTLAVYNAGGGIVTYLSDASSGEVAGMSALNGGLFMQIGAGNPTALYLTFGAGFNGNGPVLPFSESAVPYTSMGIVGESNVTIASGVSSIVPPPAAVPEPTTFAAAAFGCVVALGALRRRFAA